MDAPDTVTDAIRCLNARGFTADVQLIDGCLVWDRDRENTVEVGAAEVEQLFRFEGMSDPGDEMVVFAIIDPDNGRRGVLASAFGSAADPEVLDVLVGLSQRHRGV